MSYYDVLASGDQGISSTRPQPSKLWNFFSHLTCNGVILGSKLILDSMYNVNVTGLENFELALKQAREQNRGIMTLMNHMSSVDDPFVWACLPWKYFKDLDDIRWGMAATNICFTSGATKTFFSLGKLLPCDRFGRGPFQPAINACIRLLSPDNTLDESHLFHSSTKELSESMQKNLKPESNFLSDKYVCPILRKKTSIVHIFPEAFLCQLQPPFSNSMRFFRWGTARLILEPTVSPIIIPIFSNGFEEIKPELVEERLLDFVTFHNKGCNVHVNIGKPLDSVVIDGFRNEWRKLCVKYSKAATDSSIMPDELKFGEEAKQLRAKVCDYLREQVNNLRRESGFPNEDPRFRSEKWWSDYNKTNGKSDPEVKFIGLNWACTDYQPNLQIYDSKGNVIGTRKDAVIGPKAPKN